MTLPTTGPLSLLNIQTEHGGTAPIGFDEYYRGGANVDILTTPGTGSFSTAPLTPSAPSQIPTSGPIQTSQFYGTTKVVTGNTGPVAPPAPAPANSDYVDSILPAGVDLIRFFLIGGGGGGGGDDGGVAGGNGGGGMHLSGTINTSWAGSISQPRTRS